MRLLKIRCCVFYVGSDISNGCLKFFDCSGLFRSTFCQRLRSLCHIA